MAFQGLPASVQGVANSSVKSAHVFSVCRVEMRGKKEKSGDFFFFFLPSLCNHEVVLRVG